MRRSTRQTRQTQFFRPEDYETDETDSDVATETSSNETDTEGSLDDFLVEDGVDALDELRAFVQLLTEGAPEGVTEALLGRIETGKLLASEKDAYRGILSPCFSSMPPPSSSTAAASV